ncbi:MAG TPA: hypothetical protein VGF97_17260 [Rhizomicrobium sp.]|jgi:hypothetical protein
MASALDSAAPAMFGIGRVIARTFEVFGRNFVPFCTLSVLAVVPTMVLDMFWGRNVLLQATGGHVAPGFWLTYLGTEFVTVAIALVFSSLLQAAIVHGTITTLNGKPAGFGECLSTAWRYCLRVIGIGLLVSVCVGLGVLVLIVPGLIFAMMLAVAVPVCVAEGKPVLDSLSRSAELTGGHRWAIFAVFTVGFVASAAVNFAIRPLLGVGLFSTPENLIPGFGIFWIASALLRVLTTAIFATGVASIYYELRMIKEGAGPEQLAEVFA